MDPHLYGHSSGATARRRFYHVSIPRGGRATDAYDTTNWVGLFGAEVAASAALTGLVFVAVSINLQRILAFPASVMLAILAALIDGWVLLIEIVR